MHVAFIPYGIKHAVDFLLRDMESQKHKLKVYKKGEPDNFIWLQGQLRILPFGVYEYVFPREDLDLVLTTLMPSYAQNMGSYVGKTKIMILRKILKLKKIPKYKTDNCFLWIKDDVSIILIGIREDGELTEKQGNYVGWSHEAI